MLNAKQYSAKSRRSPCLCSVCDQCNRLCYQCNQLCVSIVQLMMGIVVWGGVQQKCSARVNVVSEWPLVGSWRKFIDQIHDSIIYEPSTVYLFFYSRYRGNRYISDVPKAPPTGWEWMCISIIQFAVFVQTDAKIHPHKPILNNIIIYTSDSSIFFKKIV